MVDLERGRIVDLLEDRKPETLVPWLTQYPGLEVINRDRAPAEQAVQVTDRWHMLQNLVVVLFLLSLRAIPGTQPFGR